MKALTFLALSLMVLSISAETLKEEEFRKENNPFGGTYLKRQTEEGFETIVELPPNGLLGDEANFEGILPSITREQYQETNSDPVRAKNDAVLTCEPDNKSKYFKFLPIHLATLKPGDAPIKYDAHCFKDNEIKLEVVNDQMVQIVLNAKSAVNWRCADGYLFSTVMNYHTETVYAKGKYVTKFKVSPKEMEMIKTDGIFIFKMCDKTISFIPSLLKTLSMFVGGFGLNPKIPFFGGRTSKTQTKNSIEFIYESTGYKWQERPVDEVVELDESQLQSGDFLAVTRFDGLDQIIQWGTGSNVGHSTMILKVNGTTYVVESQAAWYWPRENIQINTYKQWIKWARNAGFMVTLLPLKKEVAAKFDSEAVYKYFKSIEGTPYGYHNFIFGWIDTAEHSLPHLLEPEFVAAGFAILEKIIPKAVESIFTLGLNMRLGTKGLKVAEIALEASKRNLTMPQLYAMPEQDSWVYPDGISRVCSSFVVDMYKAGGLFGGVEVQASEFTPRDLYELDFFDPKPEVPEHCKKLDPTNPFCQIMGKYRIEFPRVSTISPYAHMNEKCYSEAPKFDRFPQGC